MQRILVWHAVLCHEHVRTERSPRQALYEPTASKQDHAYEKTKVASNVNGDLLSFSVPFPNKSEQVKPPPPPPRFPIYWRSDGRRAPRVKLTHRNGQIHRAANNGTNALCLGKGREGEEGRRMDMGAGDLDVPKNNTLCGPTAVLTSRSAATGTQQLVVII